MNSTAGATAQWSRATWSARPHLDGGFNPLTITIFLALLDAGLLFAGYSLFTDVKDVRTVGRHRHVPG